MKITYNYISSHVAPLKSLNQNIPKKKNLSNKNDNMLILSQQNAIRALYGDDFFHICTTHLVTKMLKGWNCVNIMLIRN